MTTKTKTKWKWEKGTRLEKGGHRVFRDARSDYEAPELRWAIADNSGNMPDQTDDGVLWLDMSRPLRVEIGYERSEYGPLTYRPRVAVPLVSNEGAESWAGTSIIDGFATLRRLFPGWHVEFSDGAKTFLTTALAPPSAVSLCVAFEPPAAARKEAV